MKSFALFLAGFAPGAALGMLSGLNLSRTAVQVAASATHGAAPVSHGLLRRIAFVSAALFLGSRFGLAGLLGAFAGVMAGFSATVARQVQVVARG
jgi:hypothetical protein